MTFGLLFSVIISDKRIFTDSGKTLVEYFAQYLAEYAFKVPKTCTNRESKIDKLYKMHTATPSGRFCGRKWTRSEASGQFS